MIVHCQGGNYRINKNAIDCVRNIITDKTTQMMTFNTFCIIVDVITVTTIGLMCIISLLCHGYVIICFT